MGLQPEDHLIVDWRADAQTVLDFCHSRLLLSLPFSNIMGPPNNPSLGRGPSGSSGGWFDSISTRLGIKRPESGSINTRESDKRDFESDQWQLVGSLQDDSRAYRNLAMELIFLCRFFVQAHEQSLNSSIRLRK